MAASRGEKHFKAGGNNVSRRKYIHIVVAVTGDTLDTMRKLEIPVSCRPARANRALKKIRTQYGNGRLEKISNNNRVA